MASNSRLPPLSHGWNADIPLEGRRKSGCNPAPNRSGFAVHSHGRRLQQHRGTRAVERVGSNGSAQGLLAAAPVESSRIESSRTRCYPIRWTTRQLRQATPPEHYALLLSLFESMSNVRQVWPSAQRITRKWPCHTPMNMGRGLTASTPGHTGWPHGTVGHADGSGKRGVAVADRRPRNGGIERCSCLAGVPFALTGRGAGRSGYSAAVGAWRKSSRLSWPTLGSRVAASVATAAMPPRMISSHAKPWVAA